MKRALFGVAVAALVLAGANSASAQVFHGHGGHGPGYSHYSLPSHYGHLGSYYSGGNYVSPSIGGYYTSPGISIGGYYSTPSYGYIGGYYSTPSYGYGSYYSAPMYSSHYYHHHHHHH